MYSSEDEEIQPRYSREYLFRLPSSWDRIIMTDPTVAEKHYREEGTEDKHLIYAFHRRLELKLFETVESSGLFYHNRYSYGGLIDMITST